MIDAEGISMEFYTRKVYGMMWKSFTLYFVTCAGRPHLCSIAPRSSINIQESKNCFGQELKTRIIHIFLFRTETEDKNHTHFFVSDRN